VTDPTLKRLANRLERLGMVTAPFADHVAVRLPLLCHVRVRIEQGRLRCEPYTGAVQRTRGTVLLLLMFGLLLVSGFRREGVSAESMTMGFLAVLAFAWETFRYVLTESCITRVQALVLAEPWLLDEEPAALAAGSRPALGTGSPAAAVIRQPARDEVRET
jgi:hypothetical protein